MTKETEALVAAAAVDDADKVCWMCDLRMQSIYALITTMLDE